MRNLIDLTSLSYHITGIERFAMCITEEILKLDTVNEYVLLFRNEIYPVFSSYIDGKRVMAKVIHGNQKLLFFQVIIPFELYRIKADNYLFFAFPSPILFFNKNIYNTIHDMGRWDCPETKGLHLFYFKTTEALSLKKAKHVFTVSYFSKERINKIMNIPLDKITVTYNGIANSLVNSDSNIGIVRSKYKLPEKYIMFLSTLQPRKNLRLLLEAYSEIMDKIDYDLVLIGRVGWNVDDLINQYNLNGRITFTGFVDDEDVAVIYKNAMCFIFPTLYEGFGIPPVEALSMGCPVISSDSSCMKEVLRKQAIYFENNNKEALKKLLIGLSNDAENMPRQLDDYQRTNYSYKVSAEKIISTLDEKNRERK